MSINYKCPRNIINCRSLWRKSLPLVIISKPLCWKFRRVVPFLLMAFNYPSFLFTYVTGIKTVLSAECNGILTRLMMLFNVTWRICHQIPFAVSHFLKEFFWWKKFFVIITEKHIWGSWSYSELLQGEENDCNCTWLKIITYILKKIGDLLLINSPNIIRLSCIIQ